MILNFESDDRKVGRKFDIQSCGTAILKIIISAKLFEQNFRNIYFQTLHSITLIILIRSKIFPNFFFFKSKIQSSNKRIKKRERERDRNKRDEEKILLLSRVRHEEGGEGEVKEESCASLENEQFILLRVPVETRAIMGLGRSLPV